MEYLIRGRLSWLRFLDFDLGAPAPNANTMRLFRDKLTEAGALDIMFTDFDRQLKERGYFSIVGQIVGATLVVAPKQRNTADEKAGEIWPDKPTSVAQMDRDARWTLKFAKAKPTAYGKLGIDFAIPSLSYKSNTSVCRTFGFIRKGKTNEKWFKRQARFRRIHRKMLRGWPMPERTT